MFKAVRFRIYEDPKRLQRILKTSGEMYSVYSVYSYQTESEVKKNK